MGEACHVHESGYCKVSVCAPLPAHRTDCSAQDWTLSNSFERHARAHCDHTPPTQHRAKMQPPYTHAQIYIHTRAHTFWLRLSSKFTCHSTFNIHTLHICRQHNHSKSLVKQSVLLCSSSALKWSHISRHVKSQNATYSNALHEN